MNTFYFPYEKLEIWKLSIELSASIYKLTANYPSDEKFGIISQMRRASNSISANIAEGSARFSEKEKARFIEIAFGSLSEVSNFLFLSKELEFINDEILNEFKLKINELSNKINSFHKKLKEVK